MTRVVAILGAHSAVARALVEVLTERDATVDLILATTSDRLDSGLVLLDPSILDRAEIFVLADPAASVRAMAEQAVLRKKPVLDLTGTFEGAPGAGFVWPGLDPEAAAHLFTDEVNVIPLGLATPIVSVLSALSALDLDRVCITTFEGAAVRDQQGMDELSAQTQAVFTMRDVEPQVFPSSLAFNCIPSLADGEEEEPEDAEAELSDAITAGLRRFGTASLPELRVLRTLVPTFSADSAFLFIDLKEPTTRDEVVSRLSKARGVHFAGLKIPSARDALDRDDAIAGRLDVDGKAVTLWIGADRLRRGSATLAALVLEQWGADGAAPSTPG